MAAPELNITAIFTELWTNMDHLAQVADCTLIGKYITDDTNSLLIERFYKESFTPEAYERLSSTAKNFLSIFWLEFDRWVRQHHREERAAMLAYGATRCDTELCESVGASGNADINGIGALASYFILTILSTLVVGISRYEEHIFHKSNSHSSIQDPTPKRSKSSPRNRVLHAMINTLPTFHDTVIVLSFAISIAAMHTSVTSYNSHDLHSIPYVTFLAVYAEAISTIRVGFIHTGNNTTRIKRYVHRAATFLILILSSTSSFLAMKRYISDKVRQHPENALENLCFLLQVRAKSKLPFNASLCLFFTAGALLLVGIGRYIAHLNKNGRMTFKHANGRNSRMIVGGYLAIGMWLNIALALQQRAKVQAWAGEKYEENTWGFGQILAIVAWLNIIMDFGYQFIYGWKRAFDQKLPGNYAAVEKALIEDIGMSTSAQLNDSPGRGEVGDRAAVGGRYAIVFSQDK